MFTIKEVSTRREPDVQEEKHNVGNPTWSKWH